MSFMLIADEERKARKLHRSVWCGELIVIGERCCHVRGIFDGDPQSNDWHLECHDESGDPEYRDELYDGFEPHCYPRATKQVLTSCSAESKS